MEHTHPPSTALLAYGGGSKVIDYGPPPGVPDEECGHAYVMASPTEMGGRQTIQHRAFFKPSNDDIERLKRGGYVVVGLVGDGIMPFSCSTFDSAGDEP